MPKSSTYTEKNPASYKSLTSLLEEHAVASSASEIHGVICGLLSSENIGGAGIPSLGGILGGQTGPVPEELKSVFVAIMGDLKSTLADGQLELALLLPDDESSISERTESLASWCRGYLLGLVEGGLRDFESLSAEGSEMLRDIIALSEMELEPSDDPQELQERDILEIEEYLKIGVQFIYEELHTKVDPNVRSNGEH